MPKMRQVFSAVGAQLLEGIRPVVGAVADGVRVMPKPTSAACRLMSNRCRRPY
jgi:hypothetical protein